MPTSLDIRARAQALDALNRVGAAATYTSYGPTVYNASTGVNAPVETTVTVKVLFTAPSRLDLERGVPAVNFMCLMAGSAVTFSPKPGDKLVFESATYTIGRCWPTYSGEQVALWRMEVVA